MQGNSNFFLRSNDMDISTHKVLDILFYFELNVISYSYNVILYAYQRDQVNKELLQNFIFI